MLSKSQAKNFFLFGTIVCFGFFIALTIHTVKQVPTQTKQSQMSESVIAGKHLWDKNNCMGCHTLLGEGAYYAPELTKVYERRGPVWIKMFIKDPEAMYPGERKMVKYNFTDLELDQLIAFLKWIGEMDLNGFPPKPNITFSSSSVQPKKSKDDLTSKAPEKFTQVCSACHSVGGQGGNVGPALDGVGSRLDSSYLNQWLRDPQAVKPGTAMPKLPLTDSEIDQLVRYLSELK